MIQDFNFRKTIQAIHYIVSRLGESNFMKIIKLIYMSDRYHLRNYGNTITADDYKALKLGPVGSATKNLLKRDDFFFQNLENEDVMYFDKLLTVNNMDIAVHDPCDYAELSLSEREALDFAIDSFGGFDQFQLADITHDYPEWKRFKSLFDGKQVKVVDMKNIDFLKNPVLAESPFIGRLLQGRDPFPIDQEVLSSIEEYLKESGE